MKKEWIGPLMILGLMFGCEGRLELETHRVGAQNISEEAKTVVSDSCELEALGFLETKIDSLEREKAQILSRAQENLAYLKKVSQDPRVKNYFGLSSYSLWDLGGQVWIIYLPEDDAVSVFCGGKEITEITAETAQPIVKQLSGLSPDIVLAIIKKNLERDN